MSEENETDNPDYSDMVPKEIELAVSGLGEKDTETKFAILMVLIDSEDKIPKQKIANTIDENESKVEELLDDLQTGGIIARYVGESIGDPTTGEYDITTYGTRILDGLYDAIQPKFTDITRYNE